MLSGQPLVLPQAIVELLDRTILSRPRAFGAWVVGRTLRAGHEHVEENGGLEGAVGVMEPVEVIGVVSVGGWDLQVAVPVVFREDILDDGARFAEFDVAIFDYGSGSGRVEGPQFWGGEERVAVVRFEGVGEMEFFAEPDDALGLGAAEVMDGESHYRVIDDDGDDDGLRMSIILEKQLLELIGIHIPSHLSGFLE